jgi:pyrroloquinoline quinone biosynthesis protein B
MPRTQSSIAVSEDGERWILINASPDIRDQVRRLPRPTPDPAVRRDVPIEAVALTDAELDHSLGLLLLREGRALSVYAASPTLAVLERDSRILPTTRAFAAVSLVPLPLDREVAVRDRAGAETGLTLEAFAVAGDAPRFATSDGVGSIVGMMVRDRAGSAAAYVPGCGAIDLPLVERLRQAEIVLFDGTFWSEEELVALDIAPTRAREMGHVPINGADGSLAMLSRLPARTRVYTHINNTNPVLIEHSDERRTVDAAGVIVGHDGMMLSTAARSLSRG